MLHDYYFKGYPGVKKAVEDFEKQVGKVSKFPIGDDLSISLLKN